MFLRAPRVKPVHRPYRVGDGRIRIGGSAYGVAAEITDPDGVVWALIGAMDGRRGPDDIARTVHDAFPEHSVEALRDAVHQLVRTGFFEDGAGAGDTVSPGRDDRYSRSVAYYSYIDRTPRPAGWDVQARIAAGDVVVLGLGGVGAACAYSLAASGVGRLTLIDGDVVELSNLNRQILYATADVGRAKVTTAAERIAAVRPDIALVPEHRTVDTEAAVHDLFRAADLVVLCADAPPLIEQWCNLAALATGTSWVNAGYDGPHISVTRYVPGQGPCWRCLRTAHYTADPQEGDQPLTHMVTAATANITGNLAAHVALAHLTGVAAPPPGEPLVWNTVRLDHAFTVDVARRADCPECGKP